ncbi:MAG: hypothetical protein HY515_01655 [Candidatus Aenigmarchaeota archaeon]|nr:hypothetical protein [Candidatus Aenigmarchaeota archaeon]
MIIPSYTSRLVAESAGAEQGSSYGSGVSYKSSRDNAAQPQGKDAKTPYILAKISPILLKGYSGLRNLFRYSRRRPRKLNGQKSSCTYCGGKPNDKPVFAMPMVAGKMGEVKKNLAPHCANCGVAVA